MSQEAAVGTVEAVVVAAVDGGVVAGTAAVDVLAPAVNATETEVMAALDDEPELAPPLLHAAPTKAGTIIATRTRRIPAC